MSAEATAKVLGLADDEQAEYAAAHKTPAPVDAGEAETGAGQDSPDADTVGASASGVPVWSAVDTDTADLLDLLAETSYEVIPEPEREWESFLSILAHVARTNDGLIDQNRSRPLLRGEVAPRRVGAYFHRAACRGLIRAEGWTTSDDREGKNSGKPTRVYRWQGARS